MNYETPIGSETLSAPRESEDAPAALRRRRVRMALLAVAIIAAVLLLWQWFGGAKDEVVSQSPQVPTVSVASVKPSAVTLAVTGTGTIAARVDMPVGVVGEGGRVTSVLVQPGTWVRAGQALATIERSVQSAQAASLAAQLATARANAKLASANLERARGLAPNGFISKADLDTRIANRDAAAAQVDVAAAQLRQAQASIARLDVRAPEAGLVLTRSVEPGQVVGAGSGVLFRIARDGAMEMRLMVNEGDLGRIRAGQSAEVRPIGADRAFQGQVWQVSPVVDPQTRQGVARILLRYDPALKPGAFAHASIATSQDNGFLLPDSAVQSDGAGSYVFVVGADNRAVRRNVSTGPVSDAGVSITNGIRAGDRVVLTAGGFLNTGDLVKPVPAR